MDLTAYIERQNRAKLKAAINAAAKLIQDCPDPEKQWKALRKLRILQERLNYPTL